MVALLEVEVRHAAAVARLRAWFARAAAALYSGLGALALAWIWQGEWFDAYDALLWLVAFVTLEINVLWRFSHESSSAGRTSAPA